MLLPLLPAALALLALADPVPPPGGQVLPPAPPGADVGFASDYDDPPKGSPEELKLWKDGIAASRRITAVRAESLNQRVQIKGSRQFERLAALRTKAGHEEGERLEVLGRRFQRAFAENADVYKSQWPLDVFRGCGYAHLYFDSALRLAPGPSRQAEVENAKEPLVSCVATANFASDRMASSNRRLAESRREVEAVLAGGAVDDHEEDEREEAKEQQERTEKQQKAAKKPGHASPGK
jgi:hypothetical protein